MSETGRPTALGVARARFVEGLPRKATELRASTALLVASPAEERPREELRRRLHALWASAQVFQIEALCDGLKDAIERLDRARDQRTSLKQDDLDALAALAATLPLLGNNVAAGGPAIPSAPPAPALLRSSSGQSTTKLRPPKASGRPTLVGMGMAMPAAVVELETVCTVAVLAPPARVQAVRAAFAGDPRLEIHVPDAGETVGAFLARCGPDAILTADATEAATIRDAASRIGAIVRVLGADVTGGLPPPERADVFARALKLTLRELPALDPVHIAARLEDLENALASDRARVSNRFDGLSIGALLDRIQTGRPDSTLHLRDSHDAIDAEMRGGTLRDVIRTANDGWYSRGAAAVVALLGMRRGLVTAERAHGPVRNTLPDPDSALRSGRERLAALERATRPAMIEGIASLEIDPDAAPSAKKERAVDPRVLDALVRLGSVGPLLEGGTSREGLSAALLALARAGALVALHGPGGEDRVAEALEIVRAEPLKSEPEIRVLTQVPPPPAHDAPEHRDGDDEDDEDDEDDGPVARGRDDEEPDDGAAEDAPSGAPERAPQPPEPTRDVAEKPTDATPEPTPAEPLALRPKTKVGSREEIERADTEPSGVVAVQVPPRPAPTPPLSADVGDLDEDEPPRPSQRPAPPPAPAAGPPVAFVYALMIAVLFLGGFVLWRFVRLHSAPPPGTAVPVPTAPATHVPPPSSAPTPVTPTSEPPVEITPPSTTDLTVPGTTPLPVAEGTGDGRFGTVRPNSTPPPAGRGWVVGTPGTSWRLDGATVTTDEPVAVALGIHAVETTGESVQVRFVRVTAAQTVVLAVP
ncbi:MAG: hypothetical protein K1X94_10750 [Sandaracinaceae bacterium]|nr:hypothetical protein [Sandaracinaceae bacterium]